MYARQLTYTYRYTYAYTPLGPKRRRHLRNRRRPVYRSNLRGIQKYSTYEKPAKFRFPFVHYLSDMHRMTRASKYKNECVGLARGRYLTPIYL